MAPGRKSLRRLQIGKETTAGTSAAASVRLRLKDSVIEDLTEIEVMEEQVGYIGGPDRQIVIKQGGQIDVPSQPATFEQLPYFFAMAFGGPVVGTSATTTDGAVSFTTNIPLTTAAPVVTYTAEGGDDFEVEKMLYTYCNRISLSGAGGETLKVAATLRGRLVTTAAGFTTATAAVLKPVEDIVFSKGKLYIDGITGSAGTTQITNQLLSAEVNFEPRFEEKYTADGNLYWSFATYIDQIISGRLTFEYDTASGGASGAKSAWRDNTPKMMRLLWTGSAITSGGAYANRTLYIDLPIKWQKVSALAEQNGNDLVTAEFRARYNLTNSTAGNGTVVVVTSKNDGSTSAGNLW